MNPQFTNASVQFYPQGNAKFRLIALWYFLTLLIVWWLQQHFTS